MFKNEFGLNYGILKSNMAKSLISCAIMAIGIWSPLIRSTNGLLWQLEDKAWLCYLIATAVALLSVFYNDLPKAIALKAMRLSCWIFFGIVMYSTYVAIDGFTYIYSETAIKMAAMDFPERAQYLKILAVHGVSLPGGWNDPLFGELKVRLVMQSIPPEIDKKIANLLNGFWVYPWGLLIMVSALFGQINATKGRIAEQFK